MDPLKTWRGSLSKVVISNYFKLIGNLTKLFLTIGTQALQGLEDHENRLKLRSITEMKCDLKAGAFEWIDLVSINGSVVKD